MKKMLLCQVNTFQFLIVQLKESLQRWKEVSQRFQFLIVQLKGMLGKQLAYQTDMVSIPYSTIKRLLLLVSQLFFLAFQFLIVQLKVVLKFLKKFLMLFQFLIVQLKEMRLLV